MLSLCFNHVATIASPHRPSVFHFLAKLSKICAIFFSCGKNPIKLTLLYKNANTFSHIKGNLKALTAVYQFEICPANYYYPGRDHETWSEFNKFSSYLRSSYPSITVHCRSKTYW